MKENWFQDAGAPNFDRNRSGIYEWRIDGVGVYVGQAKDLAKRMRAYPNNVRKILAKLPWRKGSDRPYRPVHYALRDAHDADKEVTFSILENCEPNCLNKCEQYWIKRRREELASTGLRVLNSN
jgi:hypothetical protein